MKLVVSENATAKFFKPRPVLYEIHGTTEKDLEQLKNLGVIEKMNYSDWAAPIAAVPKLNMTVHICGDFINPVLQVDQNPVPKAEYLFVTLTCGQKFIKHDLSRAYQQVLLDEEFMTINTHKDLYQYSRLPFRITSTPVIYGEVTTRTAWCDSVYR